MELIILDDFLLHTITDEREIKILFELLEKRDEQRKSTIVCSQRDPDNWKAMILNDEVYGPYFIQKVQLIGRNRIDLYEWLTFREGGSIQAIERL